LAVSPEPERRSHSAVCKDRAEQVEQGSEASYWPRRMDPTPPRNSLTFWRHEPATFPISSQPSQPFQPRYFHFVIPREARNPLSADGISATDRKQIPHG